MNDVEKRIAGEKAAVRKIVRHLKAFGYVAAGYDDGGDAVEKFGWNVTEAEVIDAVFAVDDCKVYFRPAAARGANPMAVHCGVIWFVLGNSPEEVAADYGGKEPFMKLVDEVTDALNA